MLWLFVVGVACLFSGCDASCRCVERGGKSFVVCQGFITLEQLRVCSDTQPDGVIVHSTRNPSCTLPLGEMLDIGPVRLPRRSCYGTERRCSRYSCLSEVELMSFRGCRPNRRICSR